MDPTDESHHGCSAIELFQLALRQLLLPLPVAGFLTFNQEAEQYLVTAVLRCPGNARARLGGSSGHPAPFDPRPTEGGLPECQDPGALGWRFCGAGSFVFFWTASRKWEYLVNFASNAVLERKAEPDMKRARRDSKISGQTEHVYGACQYRTRKTRPWKRRVIYKAEVVQAEGKKTQGQSALRGDQHEAESAVALRGSLLPTR